MAELFVWTEEYSVDIAEMDEQHKEFIKLGNGVLEYVKQCAGGAPPDAHALQTLIERLGNYALYHLGSEETYFQKFACEHTDHHLYAHEQFRKTLKEYTVRYRNDSADHCRLAEEIATFCVKWLLTHIVSMDKSYTACFHKNGKY